MLWLELQSKLLGYKTINWHDIQQFCFEANKNIVFILNCQKYEQWLKVESTSIVLYQIKNSILSYETVVIFKKVCCSWKRNDIIHSKTSHIVIFSNCVKFKILKIFNSIWIVQELMKLTSFETNEFQPNVKSKLKILRLLNPQKCCINLWEEGLGLTN